MRNILILIITLSAVILGGCDKRSGRLDLLVGDDSLKSYFSIESNSVTMYSSPADKEAGRIECRIYDDEYDIFIKLFHVLDDRTIKEIYRSKEASHFKAEFMKDIRAMDEKKFHPGAVRERPLAGLRVAIDPGHSAGSMNEAMRENKYMLLFTPDRRTLKFFEAQLNLATAMMLRDLLEKDGATVLLTRNANRQTYPVPFDLWMRQNFHRAVQEKLRDKFITKDEAHRLLYRAGDRSRLKFFNSEYELPYRAKLVNAFHPHITVLAHYDANEGEPAYRSRYLRIKEIMGKPGACNDRMEDIREVVDSIAEIQRDFCTVFVPGCFLRGELDAMESRIEFLRLIISPDLENSIQYSKYVIDDFRRLLKIPAAGESFPGSFHAGFCRKGIYARNFRMTRLVRGTLCLGEPLQQNNMREAVQLEDITGGKIPERVTTVARAYHDAIRKYVMHHMSDGL